MTVKLNFKIDGNDFTRAGEASGEVKRVLKELGLPSDVIRNVSIALSEGEINMYLHANGGQTEVAVSPDAGGMVLTDSGPGIENVALAMKEGYSTADDNIRSLGFGAGMGLPNIKKYTDHMMIETEVGVGTTIRLKVYIK